MFFQLMKVNRMSHSGKNNQRMLKGISNLVNNHGNESTKAKAILSKQAQLKVCCPNCQHHFKAQMPVEQSYASPIYKSPGKINLEGIVERQFNQLSPSSLIKMDLNINKLKNASDVVYSTNSYIQSQGLERLKILNDICHMQRSRYKGKLGSNERKSLDVEDQSQQTIRFIQTERGSPFQMEYKDNSKEKDIQKRISQLQRKKSNESLIQRSTTQNKSLLSPKGTYVQANHNQKLELQILTHYHKNILLQQLIEWIKSNQLFLSLPSYLRMSLCSEQMQ